MLGSFSEVTFHSRNGAKHLAGVPFLFCGEMLVVP